MAVVRGAATCHRPKLGATLGDAEGNALGLAVGAAEVGLWLGDREGAPLGDALGTDVGCNVEHADAMPKYFCVRALTLPQLAVIQPSQMRPRSQCASAQQPWSFAHGGHDGPPQSTAVSSPFRTPSEQLTHFIDPK